LLAGGSVSGLGTGGMATKLEAADIARRAGIEVVIASGHHPDVINKVAMRESVGTHFSAIDTPLESRKQWILAGPASQGKLYIDQGAATAVIESGRSLLSKGIARIEGNFERGATVLIVNAQAKVLGKGISRYCAADLRKICGKHSNEIEAILGYDYGDAAVHRNDMVVLENKETVHVS
jgi:glutamate 5-kinase